MSLTREAHLRASYHELHAERLSPEARGALWTLLAHEGERLTEAAWAEVLGETWRGLCRTVCRCGFGTLTESEPMVWVWRHIPGPSERLRRKDTLMRRKGRPDGAIAGAADGLDQD